jgi:hypothetical protein
MRLAAPNSFVYCPFNEVFSISGYIDSNDGRFNEERMWTEALVAEFEEFGLRG